MRTILSVLVFFLLIGCGNRKKIQQEPMSSILEPVPTVDLSATYPKKNYSGICDLEYIPLEKRNDAFIHSIKMVAHVSAERIVITNFSIGDILVYDGKGKILNRFNHKGGGPEEYPNIRRIAYDNKTMEIFVFTYNSVVVVYTEKGEYIRSWNRGKINSFNDVFNFDDESFIAHVNIGDKTDSSYVFVSKKDGEILSVIDLPANKIIATSTVNPQKTRSWHMQSQQLFNDGNGFLLAPISLDTVYHLDKNKHVTPVFAKTPSVQSVDPPTIVMPLIVTDRFIYLMKFILKVGADQFDTYEVLYDRQERLFYGDFDDGCQTISGITVRNTELPGNCYASLIDVHWIKECFEKGKNMDDKLKAIAKTLDDDDNPVLEIMKFK